MMADWFSAVYRKLSFCTETKLHNWNTKKYIRVGHQLKEAGTSSSGLKVWSRAWQNLFVYLNTLIYILILHLKKSGKYEVCTHQQIMVGRRSGMPGCQDRVEAQWFVTAGWHSWGRQITLSLFELTKRPSSEDWKQLHLALLTFSSSHRSRPSGHHSLSSCLSFYSFKSCVLVTSLTLSTCSSYLSFFQMQPAPDSLCAPGQSPAVSYRDLSMRHL